MKNLYILLNRNMALIIIDNVLWYGQKLLNENSDDKITLTIKDFNNYVSKGYNELKKLITPH